MKRKKAVCSIFFCFLFVLTGCHKQQEEMQAVLKKEDKSVTYVTVKPAYEDMIFEEKIDCRYTQMKKYDLSFGLSGVPIEAIYVERGDMVKKGQLLASLELENSEEEFSKLEHELKVKQLNLQQIKELKNKDLSIAKYVYQRTSNIYRYEERQEEIEREYVKEIENLEHEVMIYEEKVKSERNQISKGTIYAPVAGEITYAQNIEDAVYSKKDSQIVTVSDISECYFQSSSIDYKESFKEYFKKNEIYQIRSLENGQYCYYNVMPVNMENWESNKIIMFALADKKDLVGLGTVGNIVVNKEERNNALCLPQNVIHETDTNKFVYVLEDGIRKMRYIEVGLSCDGKTEIISGLTDKEDVIIEQSMEADTSSTEQEEEAEDEE